MSLLLPWRLYLENLEGSGERSHAVTAVGQKWHIHTTVTHIPLVELCHMATGHGWGVGLEAGQCCLPGQPHPETVL